VSSVECDVDLLIVVDEAVISAGTNEQTSVDTENVSWHCALVSLVKTAIVPFCFSEFSCCTVV